MIEIPTTQEEINKDKSTPALIKNRFGEEIVIDLYTAKRLAKNNECEIIDENFDFTETNAEKPAEKTTKKTTKTDTESEK